jgi:CP family cyanate transporter-like MFS transporter
MGTTTHRPMLVLAGIVLCALALRPQIIAIGPLVDAIDSDLGVSHTVTGLLGTIPLLCMGFFAPAAGPIAARIGATRAMTLVLLTIGIAGIARAVAPGALGVIALTVPIGVGIAIGNVLAPVIVKTAFADRPLLATGLFAFGIQIGAGAGGALAVPLADALGGWRDSLLVISAVCALVAIAWIPVARAVHMPAGTQRAPTLPWRSAAAWRLAIMFAFVSTTYYGTGAWLADAFVEHGWSEARAGSLIGILNVTALGGTLLIAFAGDRIGSRRTYLVGGLALVLVGLLLAILAPAAGIALDGAARGRRPRRGIRGGHDGPDAARRLHDRRGLSGRAGGDPRPDGRLRGGDVGAGRHRNGRGRARRHALAGLAAPCPSGLG